MRGKHERLMKRAPPCRLPLLTAAVIEALGHRGSGSQAQHGSFLERVKTLFAGLFLWFFLFLNTQVSCRPGRKGRGVRLHEVWGLALGLQPRPLHLRAGRSVPLLWIRHCVFCRMALTAGWQTMRQPSQGLRS